MGRSFWQFAVVFCVALVFCVAPVAAQNLPEVALDDQEIYNKSLRALMILFVAAVLIENALAVLFNWRVFLTYFSLRGVKTIISVVVSYIIVASFGIDVIAALLDAYSTADVASNVASKALTALILSGGSSGVNSLMRSLGYRDRDREDVVNPKAPTTQAWIAIRVKRVNAQGPVQVHVTKLANPATDPSAIAGTVGFQRPRLLELLLRNANRFPGNGGYVVEPGAVYRIEAVGYDAGGEKLPDSLSKDGREYRFAPGAIVDFEVTL